MTTLDELAEALRRELPTLEVEVVGGELILSRPGTGEAVSLGKEQISTFSVKERRRRREQGLGYLDLGTGSLYVDEPTLLLCLALPKRAAARLTPYQCALLGALLTTNGVDWFVRGLDGSQVDLIRRVKLELGVDVQPMAMSRFLDGLRRLGVVGTGRRRRCRTAKALDVILSDFQLSNIGRAASYAGTYEEVERALATIPGLALHGGVARTVYEEAGAWIEPRDYLVEPASLPEVERVLGAPVRKDYAGPSVTIRLAQRVPLQLLTSGGDRLQAVLGIAEAAKSSSPVARQKALELWKRWKSEWR